MKSLFLSIGSFILIQLCIAYVLWMGGFDFAERNFLTGYAALIGLFIGSFIAHAVYSETKNK